MREELLHLAVELCGQRLIVRQDKGRASDVTDDVSNGERLPASCDAEQGLCPHPLADAFCQLLYCLRLVASRDVF